jgi:DNA polymerase III beta subunit, N-terminal domain
MTTTATTTDTQQQVDSSNPAREGIEEEPNAEALPDDIPEFPPCEMQFIMKQDDLLEVLTIVMKALSSRATFPVLSQVLVATHTSALDCMPAHVVFTCNNLETAISMQCNAEVVHVGAFTIPAKTLLECVKTFSKGGLITVEVIEPYVQVQCGKRRFKLKGGMDASEFPALKEMIVGEGAPFALDTDLLRQAIKDEPEEIVGLIHETRTQPVDSLQNILHDLSTRCLQDPCPQCGTYHLRYLVDLGDGKTYTPETVISLLSQTSQGEEASLSCFTYAFKFRGF